MAIIAILAMIATTTSPRWEFFSVMDGFRTKRPALTGWEFAADGGDWMWNLLTFRALASSNKLAFIGRAVWQSPFLPIMRSVGAVKTAS
jgi:hypothetical protein